MLENNLKSRRVCRTSFIKDLDQVCIAASVLTLLIWSVDFKLKKKTQDMFCEISAFHTGNI